MRHSEISAGQLRVVKLLMRLRKQWLDVYQIADAGRMDVQTARRDLAVLRKAGVVLTVRVEQFGRKEYRWLDGQEEK